MEAVSNGIPKIGMTVGEAAQAMGLSRARLYGLVMGGEIASIKVGRRRIVLLDALREWMRAEAARQAEEAR